MEHLLGLISVAIALFASTNIDDVFVLVGFFADPKFKDRQIFVGQYIGIGALYAASVIASLVALVLAPPYVGLLGLVPIGLGLKKASDLWKHTDPAEDELADHGKAAASHGNIVAVAAVTMANGADNLSIYTPLFSTRSGADVAVIGIVFAVMTLVWILVARWLSYHRTIGAPIRRHGHRVLPFVLIALGGLILYEAGTIGHFFGK